MDAFEKESEDSDDGTFDKEDSGPKMRKTSAKARIPRLGSSNEGETAGGTTAAAHLDEKFPFLTNHIGHYWIAAVVFQLILYGTIWYAGTMKLDVAAGGSWADGGEEGKEGGEVGDAPKPSLLENFVYFATFWLLCWQMKEIKLHMRAAGEDELSYLQSESLQGKMKAIKRLKWHQHLCFVPQPLMAMDALVGSMGAGVLLFRYAATKTGCATGITDGLEQVDGTGWALLFIMAVCVGLVITMFFIVTRIHYAHFTAIQNTEMAQEYLQDSRKTPRGGDKDAVGNKNLLYMYLVAVGLQSLLIMMLSAAKDAVVEEGKEGSIGMAQTLYVLMGIGIFYLGQQVGHINGYLAQSGVLNMGDKFKVDQRIDWHNRNMFAPVVAAILQSFVVFPSSFALLPFSTVEGANCKPGQSVLAGLENLTSRATIGYFTAFLAFGVLQVVLLQISKMHFSAIKSIHGD